MYLLLNKLSFKTLKNTSKYSNIFRGAGESMFNCILRNKSKKKRIFKCLLFFLTYPQLINQN